MNIRKSILETYEKTKDAKLVARYFPNLNNNMSSIGGDSFVEELFLKDHADDILKEAEKRQMKEKEEKRK